MYENNLCNYFLKLIWDSPLKFLNWFISNLSLPSKIPKTITIRIGFLPLSRELEQSFGLPYLHYFASWFRTQYKQLLTQADSKQKLLLALEILKYVRLIRNLIINCSKRLDKANNIKELFLETTGRWMNDKIMSINFNFTEDVQFFKKIREKVPEKMKEVIVWDLSSLAHREYLNDITSYLPCSLTSLVININWNKILPADNFISSF